MLESRCTQLPEQQEKTGGETKKKEKTGFKVNTKKLLL